jgi:hypothetical protein
MAAAAAVLFANGAVFTMTDSPRAVAISPY